MFQGKECLLTEDVFPNSPSTLALVFWSLGARVPAQPCVVLLLEARLLSSRLGRAGEAGAGGNGAFWGHGEAMLCALDITPILTNCSRRVTPGVAHPSWVSVAAPLPEVCWAWLRFGALKALK